MASESWTRWTKWNGDINTTLADAQKELAGDESVTQLRASAGADGTRSVLDVYTLTTTSEPGKCWVLSGADLHQHFGSKAPTKRAIEGGIGQFLEKLGRGQTVAVTAYLRGAPCAVLFAGSAVE